MVFSSNLFLFLFLPIVLAGYYVAPRAARNAWLLAASLLFYGWGGPRLPLLLTASIGMNHALGAWVDRLRDRPAAARRVLILAVVLNLAPLAWFKYAGFFSDLIAAPAALAGLPSWPRPDVALPIGISFFTFQALSYVVDVYRRDANRSPSLVDTALYGSCFPQLVAGPIVRYRDVAEQMASRRESISAFAEGIERFIVGLGKKVLSANTVGAVADLVFAVPAGELTAAPAWLGLVCYTLQIYYDFSGYSDMAVGLGLMFGFRFVENFRYPYAARSIADFWRRWHVSLSVWFRDYVYIPLGGNRGGAACTYRNLLLVFLLCGLWHGAGWTFLVWGLFHGAFLVLERTGFGRRLERAPAVVALVYTLAVVAYGWVMFRADDATHATIYFAALAGMTDAASGAYHAGLYLDAALASTLVGAVVGCTPIVPALRRKCSEFAASFDSRSSAVAQTSQALAFGGLRIAALGAVLAMVSVALSAATYNPFIYFRF